MAPAGGGGGGSGNAISAGGGGEIGGQGVAVQSSTGRVKSRKSTKAKEAAAPSSSTHDPSASPSSSPSELSSLNSSELFRLAQNLENLRCAAHNPDQHPGRFPKNDPSIDLAYLNIALGQTLFGDGQPSIDATHGGFPDVHERVPRRTGSKKDKEKEKEKTRATEVGEQEHRVKLSDSTAQAASASGGSGASTTTPGSVAMQRQPSSAGLNQQQQAQQQQQQPPLPGNGAGSGAAPGMGGGMPASIVHAGQQMDINMVLSKLQELIATNDANRKQTSLLVKNAEKVAQRAFTADSTSNSQAGAGESREPLAAKAKIAELEKKLFTSEALVQVLRREQRENGKLIGEYEQALDKVVGMLRDFAAAQTEEKAALARRYLGMLQAERNEHQQTRFQRDEYLAKVMELAENIRIAYRLRCEESVPDLEIVAGLQTEVRAYRNAMGMEAEKREDETGWPVLKSVKEGEVTSAS